MGCDQSKAADVQVEARRRRLSISNGEAEGKDAHTEEEDRGLLTQLNEEGILELLKEGGGGRRFSIGSNTDQAKTSFAAKTVKAVGDEFDPGAKGVGYTCRKGLKPESPNQDSWSILHVEGNFAIYGVYDGHGQNGHNVSNFVKDALPKMLIKDQRFKSDDMPASFVDNFNRMQSLIVTSDRMKKLVAQLAGTTASIVVHDYASSKLSVAHVADSKVVLGRYASPAKDTAKTEAVELTRDHKPDRKEERARIEKSGGRVVFDGYANHRVYAKNARYPGLNMSRCLGDIMGHNDAGIIATPETNEIQIGPLDQWLLLCSDGVWEFITPAEAVSIVAPFARDKAMMAADKLAKEAWDRWIKEEGGAVVDDITVILVHLQG